MAKLPTFRDDRPCIACPLNQEGCTKIKTKGDRRGKILVVTRGPYTEEQSRDGEHLQKDAMQVFIRAMKKQGFRQEDFVFHSAVKCSYERDRRPTKENSQISEQCREYLLRVIEKMQPQVIVPLGVDATRAVYGKAKKITKVRGICEWDEDYNAHIFPMIAPLQVAMYPQNWGVFRADARSLAQLIQNDFDQRAVAQQGLGDYAQVKDLQFLIDENPEELVFDVETEGLRWADREKKLLTIQLCPEPGRAYLISWDHPDDPAPDRLKRKLRRQLKQLMENANIRIAGHNLKFDVLWAITRLGIHPRISDDTLMMAAIIDENNKNKDLSTLTKMHVPEMAGYDDLFNATYDKSDMASVPLSEIVGYGCGDVDACFRLLEYFRGQLDADEALYDHYDLVSLPGLNAFVNMELRGLMIHEGKLEQLRVELAEHVERLRKSLIRQVPRKVRKDHVEKGLKFSRPDFIRDILFDHPDGFCLEPIIYTKKTKNLAEELRKPSTSSKDHLPFFFQECPFTEELSEWMKLNRLLGTNIEKFKENYMIGDYIYPVYQLHVTTTGRTSSQDPNGQNFPKRGTYAKSYRSVFIPPREMYMLEADLSQAELRIAADMSGDPVMIQIYREGGDIHRKTALIVTGLTLERFQQLSPKEQGLARFKAKAVNFGFLYGMGWRNFIVYAKTQYGVDFTAAEAQRIRDGFFNEYRGLRPWHRAMRDFVRRHGYVRSYSGRVRHLPTIYSKEEYIQNEAERQAINSPVQEFGSTLGVIALTNIDQSINPEYLSINGFVHDAIYALCPKEYAEWGAKTLKSYMEGVDLEGMFGLTMKLPIVADVSIGVNGGEQYEMPGLDLDAPYDWENQLDYGDEEFPFPDMPEQLTPPDDGLIILPEHLRMAA